MGRWGLISALLSGSTAPVTFAAESGVTGPAPIPPVAILSLDEAVGLALAHNPEMRASSGRIAAATGRAAQDRLWKNPELTLATEEIPVSGGSFRDSKDTIGVEQTVPYPGKKKLDGRIGDAGARATEAEWNLRRVELVRDVKATFYRVLAAERLVEVSGELVQVAESSAAAARKRVDAGAAADQEQLRAEIVLDQARTELAGLERERAAARQDLAALLGRPELKEAPISGALAETPDNSLLEKRPEQWLAGHPSTAAARMVRERTELELKRARLEPYPDVTLGISGGREGPDNTSIVEFRVGIPLPIIDRSKGRKREAQANVGVAEAELAATEQRLLLDWELARVRFRTAAEQVATYRDRILPKANSALKLVQTGFQEGKFGFIDLLDTQRTTAEARLAYQQKLLELNVVQAELQALVAQQPIARTD